MDKTDEKKISEKESSGKAGDPHGSVKVADDVIAACVRTAAKRVSGMYDFSGGMSISNLLGKDAQSRGIRVNQNDGLVVDVHVIVNYGAKIPEVAWDIQENVKSEIEGLLGLEVKAVNIHVQGVHFPEEK
ncbi:MAG: Asp23/Gls24 family envelope stress response protein [Clostridiales bacterium]|nr:Asp23/Gls24 family envelope stress response protein [Clostridiales bacterium]